MAHVETDYHNLPNRCPRCGHRLEMKDAQGGCTVVNGEDIYKPTERSIPCPCRRHYR